MANDYYQHSGYAVERGTTARADQINTIGQAVESGLDKLPSEAQIKRGLVDYGTDSGTANAYIVTMPFTDTVLVDGYRVEFKPTYSNTGASTVDVDNLGIKSIFKSDGSALSANDLKAGGLVSLRYDTTTGSFRLASSTPADATAAAASAAASASSAAASSASASAAATSATNAANSASAASTSATNSASSASAASTSASNASTSATNAANSASAASTSATNAATSASNSLNYANLSFSYQNLASGYKDQAAASAASASTYASNAGVSATNAHTYETNASTTYTNTSLLYSQFDKRYLGSKTSSPTTDNTGGALTTGALYFNSTNNTLYARSASSTWLAANLTVSTDLQTFFTTPSSANLAAVVTDEKGTGYLVFSDSPALTGTPTAPTAAAGTNTTQLATTAHVYAERSNTATLTNKTLTSPTVSGNATITNGNVILSSGYGIDFSATGGAAGVSSSLLDDYEEGTWTPQIRFGGTYVTTNASRNHYTKIGRWVIANANIQFNRGTTTGIFSISGLPFAVSESLLTFSSFWGEAKPTGYSEDIVSATPESTWYFTGQSGLIDISNSNVTASKDISFEVCFNYKV